VSLSEKVQAKRLDRAARTIKILTIDIESKPHLVYAFDLWEPRIGIEQIVEDGAMFSFAAKWMGSKEIVFHAWTDKDDADERRRMVQAAHDLLSEADIVVGYNSDRYDIPRLNTEFVHHKMAPPAPYRSIDLFKTNKKLGFPSRKLDYLAQRLGVGAKVHHSGFDLWRRCMDGDAKAWAEMGKYNRQDVKITEAAFLELLPWLTNSPHLGSFITDGKTCPYCASSKLVTEGTASTLVQRYWKFQCRNCGGWSRSTVRLQSATTTRAIR
jgi:DNA polymerase elongation subunit (family B)